MRKGVVCVWVPYWPSSKTLGGCMDEMVTKLAITWAHYCKRYSTQFKVLSNERLDSSPWAKGLRIWGGKKAESPYSLSAPLWGLWPTSPPFLWLCSLILVVTQPPLLLILVGIFFLVKYIDVSFELRTTSGPAQWPTTWRGSNLRLWKAWSSNRSNLAKKTLAENSWSYFYAYPKKNFFSSQSRNKIGCTHERKI